jgi:hypothetical protein
MTSIKQIREYNGYLHTRSAIAPVSPSAGDTWDEVVGNTIRQWYWNGLLWLSVQNYALLLSSTSGGTTTSGNGNMLAVPMNFDADLFASTLVIGGSISTAIAPGGAVDSALNYFTFGLQRIVVASTTDIGARWSFQNSTYEANRNFLIHYPINTLVSLSGANASSTTNRAVRVAWTKVGSTGITLTNLSTSLIYKIARR